MELVRCTNGHWYDMEKSRDCPYCRKKGEDQTRLQSGMQGGQPFALDRGGVNDIDATVAMPRQETQEVTLEDARMNLSAGVSADESVTMGIYSRHRGTACVTGWLVAREGPVRGRDYRIAHGMNWVGRGYHMDICIPEDEDIAEKNCAVVYDGKSNQFFVVGAEGAITYLNGQLLTESRRLEQGDEITVGRSRFEFVPFCREGHVWDEEEE